MINSTIKTRTFINGYAFANRFKVGTPFAEHANLVSMATKDDDVETLTHYFNEGYTSTINSMLTIFQLHHLNNNLEVFPEHLVKAFVIGALGYGERLPTIRGIFEEGNDNLDDGCLAMLAMFEDYDTEQHPTLILAYGLGSSARINKRANDIMLNNIDHPV